MDTNRVIKVWGLRERVLLTDTSEIDLLIIEHDCFCSVHFHERKINRFVVIQGMIRIDTELGDVILSTGESFEIRPPLVHRFFALTDSKVLELAYVEEGKIDANDIIRKKQGGRMVDKKEMTEDELREVGLLWTGNI